MGAIRPPVSFWFWKCLNATFRNPLGRVVGNRVPRNFQRAQWERYVRKHIIGRDQAGSGIAGMTQRDKYLLRAAEPIAKVQDEIDCARKVEIENSARAYLRLVEQAERNAHTDIVYETRPKKIATRPGSEQWAARKFDRDKEQTMRTSFALLFVFFLATSAAAEPRDNQTITVGPWAIATNYKTDKFESCIMSRAAGELGISFVRSQDGLLVLLDSQKWKLNRGKAYPVRLVAGSRTVDAQALAETKSVTIALEDPRLVSKLRMASVLEVRGDGATLRVPLDGSAAAFDRLETCFGKRETAETNPFVAPSRKP